MVSFQCHACGDVVKKPKLDQHRTRCHSGYDCIDCSKTFNSPAEYKGHTSCISEAEKYQKSLYKGPKTGAASAAAPKNNDIPKAQEQAKPAVAERQSNAQWNHTPTTNVNNGYQGGRGGGYGGGYGSWGQRSKVTGANDTPLGTSTRPSPVAQPEPSSVPAANALSKTNGATVNGHLKDVKRIVAAGDDLLATSNKKAKVSKEKATPVVEPAADPSAGPSTQEEKKEKKTKKDKKDKDVEKGEKKKKSKREDVDGDAEITVPAVEEEKEKRKKKKEKKAKEEAAAMETNEEEGKADKKKKTKKKKEDTSVVEDSTSPAQEVEVNGKEKKRKRSEEEVVNGAVMTEGEKKRKKEKKDKSSGDAMDVDSTPTLDSTKKKDKKHKKERKDKHIEPTPSAISVS